MKVVMLRSYRYVGAPATFRVEVTTAGPVGIGTGVLLLNTWGAVGVHCALTRFRPENAITAVRIHTYNFLIS